MKRLRPRRCGLGLRVLWLFASALGLLLAAGCATRPPAISHRTVLPTPAAPVVLPAEIVGGHFFVVTRWDAHGPWRFLVDTGSSVTLVSPEFARYNATEETAANLPVVRVHSADGNSILLTGVRLQRLALGGVQFENVTALVYEFDELSAHFGFKIDGVLGFPLFHDTVATLDYPHAQLQLAPPSAADTLLPGLVVPFQEDHNRPVITTQLGEHTLTALLDTGADGALHLNPADAEPRYAAPPRPGATVSTLTGDRLQEIGRLADDLTVGGQTFTRPVVELTNQLSSLGSDVLHHFRLTFDSQRGLVGFERSAAAPIVTGPLRSAGMSFRKWPAYWRIVGIVPGSPADEARLESGDLVTRINGEHVAQWNLSRYEALVRTATEIDFTLLTGRSETTVRISTFDLVP